MSADLAAYLYALSLACENTRGYISVLENQGHGTNF